MESKHCLCLAAQVATAKEEDYELENELLPIDRIDSVELRECEQLFF